MLPLLLSIREFRLEEIVVMGILCALGLGFITWLLAGYYERRGGFGKK